MSESYKHERVKYLFSLLGQREMLMQPYRMMLDRISDHLTGKQYEQIIEFLENDFLDGIVEDVVEIYCETLDLDTTEQVIAFYESPAAKKLLGEIIPSVMASIKPLTVKWEARVSEGLRKILEG